MFDEGKLTLGIVEAGDGALLCYIHANLKLAFFRLLHVPRKKEALAPVAIAVFLLLSFLVVEFAQAFVEQAVVAGFEALGCLQLDLLIVNP